MLNWCRFRMSIPCYSRDCVEFISKNLSEIDINGVNEPHYLGLLLAFVRAHVTENHTPKLVNHGSSLRSPTHLSISLCVRIHEHFLEELITWSRIKNLYINITNPWWNCAYICLLSSSLEKKLFISICLLSSPWKKNYSYPLNAVQRH